jgi:hypothetical protein
VNNKHPDGQEPFYDKKPGQGKKAMIMRSLRHSVSCRAKTQKVSLPKLKTMEEKE